MTEQTEMQETKLTVEQKQEIAQGLQKSMTAAADELAQVTNTKVLVVFYSPELNQAGSFASTNLNQLEERGLAAMLNNN